MDKKREDGYEPTMDEMIDSMNKFEKLIEEHFDNNLTTKLQNLTTENSQLRYDLHFMEINFREACDHANEFLEKTIQLEKQVDNLQKTLDEVREQGAEHMNEAQRWRNKYYKLLDEVRK